METEEADVHVLVHSLLAAHTWQGCLIWFFSWVSSLPAPRALSWHLGLLGMLMFRGVYKHGLALCSVAAFARCCAFNVQNVNTRVTDCQHRYWILNQEQFPSFSKTGWITLLNISPALCKWWGNLIRVSSLAPLRAVCVQQVMGVCLQWDYQRLENQTEQTFKHNLFNSLFHFSPSFIPSVCLLSNVDLCSGGL